MLSKPEKIPNPFPLEPHLKLPGRLGKLAILGVLLVVAGIVLYNVCFTYIEPTQFGIKEVKLGLNSGIQEKVYEPGLAFVLPTVERIHRFPRNLQVLELTALERGLESPARFYDNPARIQTSDGFHVDVDATIIYRIEDPYKVITTLGPGEMYRVNGLLPKAEPRLKQALGELTTEDFYNSFRRVEKAQKARDLLIEDLAPKGIKIEQVLIRYFKYSDEIQKNIEEKKLQDQLVFKNQAEEKAAIEQATLKRVSQEGEMQVKITLEGGQAYRVQKNAERDLYTRKKKAEADLLVKLAEAKRTELTNEAMQSGGSDKMVALRMAEVMHGLDTILVPSGGANGLNPLNLDEMATLFGVDMGMPGEKVTSPSASAPIMPEKEDAQ